MCLVLTETWIHLIEQKYISQSRGKPQYEESIVAGFLDNLGFSLEYEREYLKYNKTPDWTVLDNNLSPTAIVEVLTINENQNEIVISQPQVKDLLTRLHKVNIGAVLNVTLDDETVLSKKLTSSVNKKISIEVAHWLKDRTAKKGDLKVTENIEFEFVTFTEKIDHIQEFVIKPKKLIGRFDVYEDISKTRNKILTKIAKYKELAINENLSFVIGLIANSLVVKNEKRVESIITKLFDNQDLLSSAIVFNKNLLSKWEVKVFHNSKARYNNFAEILKI